SPHPKPLSQGERGFEKYLTNPGNAIYYFKPPCAPEINHHQKCRIFWVFLRVGCSRQLMLVENYNIIEVMHPKVVAVGDVIWRYLKNHNSP
ncbi:hypothetical protein, partial [Limnospira sp. PMC 289.06]|uniref:hypothetical protein n=1 Tax=Limnospira sp. PMC 289.06 TaxID=2981094 RepID=UPI0028E13668|nr:hypothetical protein [Limnospira sp. PMC 289.06]